MSVVLAPSHRCCYLHLDDPKSPCGRPATHSIWPGDDPYDFTEACMRHVEDLRTGLPGEHIYLIATGEDMTAVFGGEP